MKRFFWARQEEIDTRIKATFVFISVLMPLMALTLMIAPIYFKKTASLAVLQPSNTVQNLVHFIIERIKLK